MPARLWVNAGVNHPQKKPETSSFLRCDIPTLIIDAPLAAINVRLSACEKGLGWAETGGRRSGGCAALCAGGVSGIAGYSLIWRGARRVVCAGYFRRRAGRGRGGVGPWFSGLRTGRPFLGAKTWCSERHGKWRRNDVVDVARERMKSHSLSGRGVPQFVAGRALNRGIHHGVFYRTGHVSGRRSQGDFL